MKPVVSNSSPLIVLSKIGLLNLLESLFERIMIPEEVYCEVVTKGKGRPGAKEVEDAGWIEALPADMTLVDQHYSDIFGAADASVIALARQRNASLVIVDDEALRQARE